MSRKSYIAHQIWFCIKEMHPKLFHFTFNNSIELTYVNNNTGIMLFLFPSMVDMKVLWMKSFSHKFICTDLAIQTCSFRTLHFSCFRYYIHKIFLHKLCNLDLITMKKIKKGCVYLQIQSNFSINMILYILYHENYTEVSMYFKK